jgi:UV DNA damage endonuclease
MDSIQKNNLNMGYCCINVYLRKLGIFCSRTCRLETIKQRGIAYSYELAKQNLEDMACILRWNYNNNIYLYRMSSEMFPFATHPDYYKNYDLEQFKETLYKIGIIAKECKQQLTFHPGQYNQLSSERESVVEKSIIEIDFHAKIMELIGVNKNGIIIIHGGGKSGGQEKALQRFEKNFIRLSKSSQERLVLENCEMAYSVEDLLPMCKKLKIPIVLDYHHHNINPGTKDLTYLTSEILEIWDARGIIPLFHLSESRVGITKDDSITARRAHSDYIENLPNELLELLKTRQINLDIEAKMKEQAVLRIFIKYYQNEEKDFVNKKYLLN